MSQEDITLTAQERIDQIREIRKDRRPMDGLIFRFLAIPPKPGFKTHWFNDEYGRIEAALRQGWEFSKRSGYVDSKVDLIKTPNKRIKVRVGVKEDLSDLFAYAMDIPEQIAAEDRRQQDKVVDRRNQYIKNGGLDDNAETKAVSTFKSEVEFTKRFQPD